MLDSQSQSLFAGDPFRLQECQPTESTEECLSSMDGMGSCFPVADQNSDTFRTDLSWDDWLSLGLVAEPNFNMPHECPLPHNSASGCPSLDSNASPDQLTTQGWPMNFLEDPQLNFPSCPQTTVQQDIETCIPHLSQPSTIETLSSPIPKQDLPSATTKKPVSPTKRKYGLRTKPEAPAQDPPAKKEPKSKATTTTSTRTAHSIIEHNYRKNLNTKMEQLRQILSVADSSKNINSPETAAADNGIEDTRASSTTTTTTIPRKSDILIHAYGYVKRSEREKKNMADENAFLKRRLVALEKLVKCEDCSLLKQMNRLQMGGGGGVVL